MFNFRFHLKLDDSVTWFHFCFSLDKSRWIFQHLNPQSESSVALKLELAIYFWISWFRVTSLAVSCLDPDNIICSTCSHLPRPPPTQTVAYLYPLDSSKEPSEAPQTSVCMTTRLRSDPFTAYTFGSRRRNWGFTKWKHQRCNESNSDKPLNDNVLFFSFFFLCSCSQWMPFLMQRVLCFAGCKISPIKLKQRNTLRHRKWLCKNQAKMVWRISRWNTFDGKFLSHYKIF